MTCGYNPEFEDKERDTPGYSGDRSVWPMYVMFVVWLAIFGGFIAGIYTPTKPHTRHCYHHTNAGICVQEKDW